MKTPSSLKDYVRKRGVRTVGCWETIKHTVRGRLRYFISDLSELGKEVYWRCNAYNPEEVIMKKVKQ